VKALRARRFDPRFAGIGAILLAQAAAAGPFVKFEHLADEGLVSQTFRLTAPRTVHVVCEGASDGADDEMYAYGWILNLQSRDVVWSLRASTARRARGRNYAVESDVTLPAGDYAAYYAAFGDWRSRVKIIRFMGREIGRIEIDDGRKKRSRRDSERWGLSLQTGQPDDPAVETPLPPPSPDPRLVVQITGTGDNSLEQRGFTLPGRMPLTVYCVGEIDPDEGTKNDFGWILEARSRKKVWELDKSNFKHAGGARMNKYARETITLPAGDYMVSYSTDTAHSPEGWWGPPPYDPDSWGITVWAQSAADAARIRPYADDVDGQAIVALVRQRNDSYSAQGLTVTKPAQVRVYALGEYQGRWADEGWIEDFRTQRRVWGMSESNTLPAGGASKNRMVDEIVSLSPGDYVVRYRTDDSHAFKEWNAAPPNDPAHWGITLLGAGRGNDRSAFQLFDPEERESRDSNDLARLFRVGDDARVQAGFRLDRRTQVHIVAVGEGQAGEMYDYGWIEAANGNSVWEMTMRNTHHAGGADKNRAFDGVIPLERGEYRVHFVTDGSHSWDHWNADHPEDPFVWGIRVWLEK